MSGRQLIAVAAGGTGGHLYPAVALSDELVRRGYRVQFMTDERGAAYGGLANEIDRQVLAAGRIDRGRLQRIAGVARLAHGTFQAVSSHRRTRPALVAGFGGYPSIAPMVAARLCGIPSILHEQNALLGRANRLTARFATAIALSFKETARVPAAANTHLVGNPVRREFVAASDQAYQAPAGDEALNILVLGGSQGATILSQVLPAAVENLGNRSRVRVYQQCRPEDLERTRDFYRRLGVAATVTPFFEDVAVRLREAHLVISRAGASTMAELGAVGRPAVLVPYPHAAEDHQLANARAMAATGGAWVFPQNELTADRLCLHLSTLMERPAMLTTAAAAARTFGHRDAAARLADLIAATASAHHTANNHAHQDSPGSSGRPDSQLRGGLA